MGEDEDEYDSFSDTLIIVDVWVVRLIYDLVNDAKYIKLKIE